MRTYICLIGGLSAMGIANAQSGAPTEVELEAETVIVVSPVQDDDGLAETEMLLGEISLKGTAERVLDNGVRLRARTALRLQQDHSARPGASGGFNSQSGAPTGGFSGLSAGSPIDQDNIRVRFESAYFQIDGGYGELRLGRDKGVAGRFHEGLKSTLTHARLDSTLLDPAGVSTVRTRNDLTGSSAKISYASPRIVGLRAGLSYTPEANADGLDRRPAAGTGGTRPDTRNAFEVALNGTHRFRESGLRIDAALAWSTADIRAPSGLAPYDRVETLSTGTRIEKGDWTIGASWLSSDNGLPDAEYSAWSFGIARPALDTDWSLSYGESSDDGANTSSTNWRLGAARPIGENLRVALAYRHDDLDNSLYSSTSQGVVVEITLSSEILKLTGN